MQNEKMCLEVEDVELPYKRCYHDRELQEFKSQHGLIPNKRIKFSDGKEPIRILYCGAYKILKLLSTCRSVIVDLDAIMSSRSIEHGSSVAYVYYNDVLFVKNNGDLSFIQLLLMHIEDNKNLFIFFKTNISQYMHSFIPKHAILIFCGTYNWFSYACSLSGVYKKVLFCSHFYGIGCKSSSYLKNAIHHLEFVMKRNIHNHQ